MNRINGIDSYCSRFEFKKQSNSAAKRDTDQKSTREKDRHGGRCKLAAISYLFVSRVELVCNLRLN